MENKITKKEQANPVFNTAKYTLYNLSKSGIEEAEKYLKALGFDESQISAYGMSEKTENKMAIPNLITQEARYCFINRIIEEKGYKNIFDLACGFSPRGYKYSKSGCKYIGADLPATVELVKPVAEKAMDSDCKIPVEYRALDLTNPSSVVEAAKGFDGEVCITTEGLLMYLDASETAQFAEGVRAVLKEHGGCFVTPDFCTGAFFKAIVFSMFGSEEGLQLLYDTQKTLEKTSDAKISTAKMKKSFSSAKGDDAAKEFFEARGLKVERIPFFDYSTKLSSLEKTDSAVAETIKAELNKIMAWVVTADDNFSETDTEKYSVTEKKSTMSVNGEVLEIEFAGRVDSINAPELIEMFEQISKHNEISKASVDMKNLEYISSAGLRFLLTVKKKLSGKYVGVKNINSEVMDILNTTGFTEILDIEL